MAEPDPLERGAEVASHKDRGTDMDEVFVTGASGILGRSLVPQLVARGHTVRAMARTADAARKVEALGANPIRCDLDDLGALTEGIRGCRVVIHGAARFREGGGYGVYEHDNVTGTQNVLRAAVEAGSRRLVYVGAAGCLVGAGEVRKADETWPLQRPRYSPYFATKTIADEAVLAANAAGLETMVVRPGLIWGGRPDPFVDGIVEATRSGKMRLIDGGRHEIVTSHVDNAAYAVCLAVSRGTGGQAYYAFDDGTIQLRDFVAQLLAARGLDPPTKSIPFRVAWPTSKVVEWLWSLFRRPGPAPITREMVRLTGGAFIVSDSKARTCLGYAPLVSREIGIDRMVHSEKPAPGVHL